MKTILALLVLSMLSVAALDQTYVHVFENDGSSTIERTADIALLSLELKPGSFERMAEVCELSDDFDCSVDVENKVVVLKDSLQSGGYYTYEVDYGFPFTTTTLTVNSIPTDRFSRLLDRLFDNADAMDAPSSSASPIYLREKEENQAAAVQLRDIGVELTYIVEMPATVSEASAGEVMASAESSRATFDLVEVLGESEPMVVKSTDLNYTYIIAVLGAVVLVYLGWSFMQTQQKPSKKPRKKGKK